MTAIPASLDSIIGEAFSHLFDTPSDDPHNEDIGLWVRYTNPTCIVERRDVFEIVAIQKKYNDTLAYRVVGSCDVHRFGRVADFEAVEFCDAPTDEDIVRIQNEMDEDMRRLG